MIGFFGGGFDPVHQGHIHSAQTAMKQLSLEKLFLIPYAKSTDKNPCLFSKQQRLDMLEIATQSMGNLLVDKREINRTSTNYTIDTLLDIRGQYPNESICFLMGMDSFNRIKTWKNYQQLTHFCHLVVINRPHYSCDNKIVAQFTQANEVSQLLNTPSGLLFFLTQTDINLSSRQIRDKITAHQSLSDLLPKPIIKYILNASTKN